MAILTGPQGLYLKALASSNGASSSGSTSSSRKTIQKGSQDWIDNQYELQKDDYVKELLADQAKRGIYNSAASAAEESSYLDNLKRQIESQASDYNDTQEEKNYERQVEERNFNETKRQNAKQLSAANKQQALAIGSAVASPFINNFLQTTGWNPITKLYNSVSSGLGNSAAVSSAYTPNTLSLGSSSPTSYSEVALPQSSYLNGLNGVASPSQTESSVSNLNNYYSPTSTANTTYLDKVKNNFSGIGGNALETLGGTGVGMLLGDNLKNSLLTSAGGTILGNLLGGVSGLGSLGSLGGYLAPLAKWGFGW